MPTKEAHAELEALLTYLKKARGFDFTAYKRPSLTRRIRKQMQNVNIDDYAAYRDYLETHPDEFNKLFNTILINVTCFFRDKPAWDYLAAEIIPRIVARAGSEGSIRVWSAGCASGEEPCTLAMLFAEAMDRESFRERVKIYATDCDEESLAKARSRRSTRAREVAEVPPDLLKKYFTAVPAGFQFDRDFRRGMIFGRHDLIQDAPISRIDLLVSRNTLMYFNADVQTRILARMFFALKEDGYLFRGRAETLHAHADSFEPMDVPFRIFRKTAQLNARQQLLAMVRGHRDGDENDDASSIGLRLEDVGFELDPAPQLILGANGFLVMANSAARALFVLTDRDLGRPMQDLEISYRPVDLRSLIDKTTATKRPTSMQGVVWPDVHGDKWIDVTVIPLLDPGGSLLGTKLVFMDVSGYKRLEKDVETARRDAESAYEELQSTNEELETTNEELQSTIEELETTNEELQSSNEELETMNEELQSTNAELETVNGEMILRGEEAARSNLFLQGILGGLRVGVVVVDLELRVMIWNHRAEDLWGLRETEVKGRHLLNLDIGLKTEHLKPMLRAAIAGEVKAAKNTFPATNRRGKMIQCEVTCTPMAMDGQEIRGAILLMDDAPLDPKSSQ